MAKLKVTQVRSAHRIKDQIATTALGRRKIKVQRWQDSGHPRMIVRSNISIRRGHAKGGNH